MTTLRAIIYCRVSSKEQTQNLSLPVQEDQCRTFCKLNSWEVDRVFIERGESAKTANRTELQATLAYLRDQNKRRVNIHVFVVTNVDRFARDAFDHAIIRRHLAGLGVTLRSVSQPIDFAERVSLNASRLWLETSLEQRQRFQAFLFPEGLQVEEGGIRTPVTASFYEELRSFTDAEERLACLEGFEPPTRGLEGRRSIQLSYRQPLRAPSTR